MTIKVSEMNVGDICQSLKDKNNILHCFKKPNNNNIGVIYKNIKTKDIVIIEEYDDYLFNADVELIEVGNTSFSEYIKSIM